MTSSLGHRASLDDELRGFRNGHEVAGYLRMCQGNGAAFLDLLPEKRHDGSGRTEYIPKADHGKIGSHSVGRRLRCERLQNHLRQSLAGPHHVRGTHGLVCTDQHEIRNAAFIGRARRDQRTHDIVLDAFHGIMFDKGHMLVSGCMIERVRSPALHDMFHAILVANGTKNWDDLQIFLSVQLGQLLQFGMDIIKRKLVLIEEDQGGRLVA